MSQTLVVRKIQASPEEVFRTISTVSEYSNVVEGVVNIEFLSDRKNGVGTVFKETREINGKESTVELEITEYDPPQRVRFVSDSHGTIWDSVYTVTPENGATKLSLTMTARAHKLASKLMIPLMKGMVAKALEDDMDAVKAYCEGARREDRPENETE